MEVDSATILCCRPTITGLMVVIASLMIPWYQLDGVNYQIMRGEDSTVSPDRVVLALNLARASLAFGSIFGWLYLLVSIVGRSRLSIWVGWITVGLLLAGIAYALSRAGLDAVGYKLELGWLMAVFGLLLVSVASIVEMSKYFAGERRHDEDGPFSN